MPITLVQKKPNKGPGEIEPLILKGVRAVSPQKSVMGKKVP